jgi:hypothetical protein
MRRVLARCVYPGVIVASFPGPAVLLERGTAAPLVAQIAAIRVIQLLEWTLPYRSDRNHVGDDVVVTRSSRRSRCLVS